MTFLELMLLSMRAAEQQSRAHSSHAHQCTMCRQVWQHADTNAGNEFAHMCPRCGSGPYWDRIEG